ncbi:VOC family protein [Deinococcus psychrotolerans]|uniref:Bleomycin resistance protein n=1 Tax=Deinococcus psychrotolerans TaxID=2489213 RepID=A0A3G8Y9V0_9DEIO|nr:VOC family protein [Deinococcus psychrotolerans]AZI42138.1 VOC family protein [Deinococcus psychrotolerans]
MTEANLSHVPITEWAALVPELDVRDLAHSQDVYTRLFGFTVNYTRPGFVYLSLGRIQWMLSQIREGGSWQTGALDYPLGRGINFQISVLDVDALYKRLEADSYPIYVPMKTSIYLEGGTEHEQREFLVLDPDGYLLRFTD